MSETREKRERKATVEVYTVDSPTKKEFVIAEGKGTKLGDIPSSVHDEKTFTLKELLSPELSRSSSVSPTSAPAVDGRR